MAQRTSSRKTGKARRSTAKAPARSAKAAPRSRTASKKDHPSVPARKSQSRPLAVGDREVTIDRRRGDATVPDDLTAPVGEAATAPKLERRKKVNRRRQIDPTTCERDYTDDEVEFMNAIDDYKRKSGRMFPTCSEVLEVLRGLGYQKTSFPQVAPLATPPVAVVADLSIAPPDLAANLVTHAVAGLPIAPPPTAEAIGYLTAARH